MHLQGTLGNLVVSSSCFLRLCSALMYELYPYQKALILVPYFMHLAGLKWHEYDESALANPNRCKVKNWADARRLSPRWNHCHWRDLSLIICALGIVG